MNDIVPSLLWQTCTGKATTVVITDPCNIFHRAKPATGGKDRISITFGYTSRIPKIALSEFKLSGKEWELVAPKLSLRQLACLRREKNSVFTS